MSDVRIPREEGPDDPATKRPTPWGLWVVLAVMAGAVVAGLVISREARDARPPSRWKGPPPPRDDFRPRLPAPFR